MLARSSNVANHYLFIFTIFVDMVWVGLGCGSVGVDGRLTWSYFVRNLRPFSCRLYNSSSSCRTSVQSSL